MGAIWQSGSVQFANFRLRNNVIILYLTSKLKAQLAIQQDVLRRGDTVELAKKVLAEYKTKNPEGVDLWW